MFDWFWELPLMVTLQTWVDSGREAMPGPLVTLPIAVLALLVILWRLQSRTGGDGGQVPGYHFKGKITPKTINRMTQNNRVRPLQSREAAKKRLDLARSKRNRR